MSWDAANIYGALAEQLQLCSVEGLLEYVSMRGSGGAGSGVATGGPVGGAFVAGSSILACGGSDSAGSSGTLLPGGKCAYGSLGSNCARAAWRTV
jgi:hypothetical protein